MEDIKLNEQSERSSAEDMSPDSNDETNSTASSSSSSPDSFKAQTGKLSHVALLNITQ